MPYIFCRQANRVVLENLMNKQYVDRVEVVMKETIGVKGKYFEDR